MTVSRFQLFAKLGLIKVVEPTTQAAYTTVAENEWRSEFLESPHGTPWHTSFHASQFPGGDDRSCARKALYSLMNIPRPKPIDRGGRTVMAAGRGIEYELVKTFHDAGVLLSAGPDDPVQTGFVDPEHWLTGNTDAVILPEGWTRGHVVEVKSKDHDVVVAMRNGERGPDPEHIRQLKTYIGMANEASTALWPDLDPPETGSIYYLSRNRPNITAEFFYHMDDDIIADGKAKLATWKDMFINDELPARPHDWMWTAEPCKYCQYKNLKLEDGTKAGCKQDDLDDVTKLSESSTIRFASELNTEYEYDLAKTAVLARWKKGRKKT